MVDNRILGSAESGVSWALRAHLLARLGRTDEARAA
jgi:predicted RNA polymerase sigma factor